MLHLTGSLPQKKKKKITILLRHNGLEEIANQTTKKTTETGVQRQKKGLFIREKITASAFHSF